MATVTITIRDDEDGGVGVNFDFDPPLVKEHFEEQMTPAMQLGLEVADVFRDGTLVDIDGE